MELILSLTVLMSLLSNGLCFDQDRSVILSENDDFSLPCTMDGVNLQTILDGNAAASWMKTQPKDNETNPAQLSLNNGPAVMPNIPITMKPHVTFKYNYVGDQPPVSLALTLTNVRYAESGKYACVIQKNGNTVHTVTYTVMVLTRMSEVILFSKQDSSQVSPNSSTWTETPTITLGTRTNGYLGCVATGGYPLPTLQVTVGQRSLTGLMKIRRETFSFHGESDFEKEYMVTRYIATDNFPVDLNEDGATVKCTALIEDSKNNEFHKLEAIGKLSLNSKPVFQNCSTTFKAALGTKEFEIKCQFVAKPAPKTVQWFAETTQDTVSRTDGSDGDYVATMMALGADHKFEGVLKVKEVRPKDFQRYKLTLGNSEGTSEITVTLNQGSEGGSTQGSSMNLASALTILVATLLAAFMQ